MQIVAINHYASQMTNCGGCGNVVHLLGESPDLDFD